ncbi:RNB domain-containing ribonuclease [Nitriliruptor alkaliphilus]|uniref:RNB domain-containing ribonuclease n=1 Tax=Nitriliruptor alkaliphilus TaxID=427918 RepID=UPI00069829C9|nr:RNB domain-containing ribonuclease [Nitriliruptor alkaliphilus]
MPVRARFRPHPRGFGFLTPVEADGTTSTVLRAPGPDGVVTEHDGIFVPPALARELIADDLVDAEVEIDGKGASATATALVDRPRRMLVGTVQHGPGGLVIDPDPQLSSGAIPLAAGPAAKLPTSVGRLAVVLLSQDEEGGALGQALVAGPFVVGSPQAVRAAATVIALGRAAPTLVPGGPEPAGLDVTEALATHTRLVGHLASGGRGAAAGLDTAGFIPGPEAPWVDRRDEPCVTVDSATTRDLDDAVGASWDGSDDSPVHVAVHIADAGRAIGIDSPADRYARVAGATAYLAVGDNAPMLDPALSEDTLSLRAGEDRFALSVRFTVSPDGALGGVEVEVAAVTSRAQLTYGAVDSWLEGDEDAVRGEAGLAGGEVVTVLRGAVEAARRLGVERDDRATFEDLFSSPEHTPAIIGGKLTTVEAEPHAAAYRFIERLMVAANESVASWLISREVPALYRAHVGVDPERAERLQAAATAVGIELKALEAGDEDQVSSELMGAIEQLRTEGRDEDHDLLVAAATGSIARATYDPDPSHHRGLASGAYVHFTSPIRRYADLVVHRQIRAALAGDPPPYDTEQLRAMATWLDARAGAIDHLTSRERSDLWARLLDRGFLGSTPEPAVVTGVTTNGVKVRLGRLGVTGFVTAERLLGLGPKERGRLDVDEHGIVTTTGTWKLGQRTTVRFVGLDDTGRTIWRLGDSR